MVSEFLLVNGIHGIDPKVDSAGEFLVSTSKLRCVWYRRESAPDVQTQSGDTVDAYTAVGGAVSA